MPKSSLEMKNGQQACNPSLAVKRLKMSYDMSTTHIEANWSLHNTSSERDHMPVTLDLEDQFQEVEINAKDEAVKRYITSLRPWQWTSLGQRHISFPADEPALDFKLMSYNILAQELLACNRYLYKHCKSSVLSWQYRQRNLISEITEEGADIICLQEVQEDHFIETFQPKLKALGYQCLYKKRTGDKNDGCAIFFKSDLFALDWHIAIEYYQPGIPVLDRDNIGLIAVLVPLKNANTKLCVATTHLLFNPKRGDIKLAQLQVFLAELDKAAFKGTSDDGKARYYPSIMCGDMNSEPFSPLYNFLTRGILHYYGIQSGDISGQREGKDRGSAIHRCDILLPDLGITTDCQYAAELECRNNGKNKKPTPPVPILEHGFRLESAYRHTNTNGTIEVTTQHMKANCTVDYILYSAQHLKNNPLSLLGTRRLLTDEEVASVGGLPNSALSSDHLALVAKFRLRKVT